MLKSVCSFVVTRHILQTLISRRVDSLCVGQVESLYHTPLAVIFLVVRRVGSFSFTLRAEMCLVVKWIRTFSYTRRVAICVVVRQVGNLSYTPHASMSSVYVSFCYSPRDLSVGSAVGGSLLNPPC